jgi:hypothetical protein
MTKSYSYSTQITLKIVDIPAQIAIENPEVKIPLELEAIGFRLWVYNITKKKIEVSYDRFEIRQQDLVLNTNGLKQELLNTGDFTSKNITFLEDKVMVSYYEKDTKTVAVHSNISYDFADGYNTLEPIRLEPDSVVVSGSSKDLNAITFVDTEKKSINAINQNQEGTVNLISDNPAISLSTQKVDYYLNVEKFSENSVMVDIEMINVPDSIKLNIFPAEVKVSFLVSLKSFEKVSKEDFKVVCDYNKRFPKEAVIIPELIIKPDNIKNAKMHSSKVDYLLVQDL